MSVRLRAGAVAFVALAAVCSSSMPAQAKPAADIVPVPDRSKESRRAGLQIARAIADDPSQVRSAAFSALPPFSNPAAISTKRLAGFPRDGGSFAILSTGSATRADSPNNSGQRSKSLGGPSIRGARDVTILRIVVNVPKEARCLSIRFRFLSEEFPEFVNDDFNDAFVAELDTSNWDASSKEDPSITAPNSFATDTKGNPIRVNAVGDASVNASRAKGTTYDAATRLLRASTPVTSGRHILYLSIFDQGDRQYDSAVFLDRLTIDRHSPCKSGAVPD